MNAPLSIPPLVVQLFVVLLFGVSLGIEQSKRNAQERDQLLGTDRTFTFIGLLGYILLVASPTSLLPYLVGFGLVGVLLAVFYFHKVRQSHKFGLTSSVLGLLTYAYPLLVITAPLWLALLVFVIVLAMASLKEPLRNFTSRLAKEESITLAKFVGIAGVVLPLLDDVQIAPWLPVSPRQVWLAVVVVSAISYLSYLLRRYAFPKAGLLLTAVLGGLYSSTASTLILSKKSQTDTSQPLAYAAALLVATAMMFIRIWILALIFNTALGSMLAPALLSLFVCTLIAAWWLQRAHHKQLAHAPTPSKTEAHAEEAPADNPLEFRVAIIFAALFVAFSSLTHYVLDTYGHSGLTVLSLITGFTDIDPFLLNLFQGVFSVATAVLATATLQAIVSNNILKAVYCRLFAAPATYRPAITALAIVIGLNLLAVLALYLYIG